MGDPLDEATAPLDASAIPVAPGRLPFERVGPYRLVGVLGAGGMGEVFLAERDDEAFRQQVAIKLVPFALTDGERAVRLRRERQILAQLDHPNLVRVLDGGVAPDGTPYIAMEYVRGRLLRNWVKETNPGLEQRLERFLELCAAVSYAHQRLVVHRDIKPGNIMVDEHGHARLLDFGIAKLLTPEPSGDNMVTVAGVAPLTAAYAAPEQVLGTATTTATDIYQLGLVLYELLTGKVAQPVSHTARASEIERFVCRVEPPPPSRAGGGEHAVRLPSRVAHDFDIVVATALHKEPDRRYRSAAALADDIRRILAREPIEARRDSVFYRTRRFIERHAMASFTALGLLVSLAAFALHERSLRAEAERLLQDRDAALAQARSAQARAEAVQSFLVDMLGSAGERGNDLRVTELLDSAQEALKPRLANDPDTSVAVVEALAKVRVLLHHNLKATELFDSAMPVLEQAVGEDDPRLLRMLRDQIFLADAMGDYHRKLELAELRYRRLLRSQGPIAPDTLVALSDLGISRYFGQPDRREQAFAEMREAAEKLARVSGEFDPEALQLRRYELQFRYVDGRHREVVETGTALYERASAATGAPHDVLINILGFVMNSTVELGDYERAMQLNDDIKQMMVELRGPKSASLVNVMSVRGRIQLELGDYAGARRSFEEGLAIAEPQLGTGHPSVYRGMTGLATALSLTGQHAQAIDLASRSVQGMEQSNGPESNSTVHAMLELAIAYARAGELEQAEHWLQEAESRQRPRNEANEPYFEQRFAVQRMLARAWRDGPQVLGEEFIERVRAILAHEAQHRNTIDFVMFDLRALRQRYRGLPAALVALQDEIQPRQALVH